MSDSLPLERLRVLLDQIAEERGYGWQTSLAKETGKHQTTLSKIQNRTRGTGVKTIEAIRVALAIRSEFFFDAALGDAPDYRDFVGAVDSRVEPDDRVAWLNLEAEGYVDYARAKGVDELAIQHIRRTPDARGGITEEDLRRMLNDAILRARRSVARDGLPLHEELPQAKAAREKRAREGGLVEPLKPPEDRE